MKKFKIYSAVDSRDGELSIYYTSEDEAGNKNWDCIYYSDMLLGSLVKQISNGLAEPYQKGDPVGMVNPRLVCEINVGE